MTSKSVITIGYGDRTFEQVADLLVAHEIKYLIDIRSAPHSKHNLDFNRERLRLLLSQIGIRYVFMGDSLGGRPTDPSCYRDGRVDYRTLATRDFYCKGIERVCAAVDKGFNVALMCSELHPQACHRSKLVGRTLEDAGIEVRHLDSIGQIVGQGYVVALAQPQHALFEGDSSFSSRKQYNVPQGPARGEPEVSPCERLRKVVTIGVYGFDEEEFFWTLRDAKVGTFCDLRQRRGMRGKRYAFVNSTRLQQRLKEMGIRYVHYKDLAPDADVRKQQAIADGKQGWSKRSRQQLSAAFKKAYRDKCLATFDASSFVHEVAPARETVALFCVEHEPEACHRSLVAERLVQDLKIQVEHLKPCELSLSLKP